MTALPFRGAGVTDLLRPYGGVSVRTTSMSRPGAEALPAELERPGELVALAFEAQQPTDLPAREQHGEALVLVARPQVAPRPPIQVEQGHRLVAGALEGVAELLLVLALEADERGRAMEQQRLAGLRPALPEVAPLLAVPRGLDRPPEVFAHDPSSMSTRQIVSEVGGSE